MVYLAVEVFDHVGLEAPEVGGEYQRRQQNDGCRREPRRHKLLLFAAAGGGASFAGHFPAGLTAVAFTFGHDVLNSLMV